MCWSSCGSRPPTAARSWSGRRLHSSPGCGAAASSPSTAWWRVPCLLASAVLACGLPRGCARGASRPSPARSPSECAWRTRSPCARSKSAIPRSCSGGCLCVAAALLASGPSVDRRRALWAGVILGLAIANKEWALLAIGPVLLGLPAGLRRWCLIAAAAVAAALLAPLALVGSERLPGGHARGRLRALGDLPAVAGVVVLRPPRRARARAVRRAQAGLPHRPRLDRRRQPPADPRSSELALPAALWLRRRPSAAMPASRPSRVGARILSRRDALLALALLLLLRCVLDTWDAAYYPLPFVLALLAWEALGPADRRPGAGALQQRARVDQLPMAAECTPPPMPRLRSSWPGPCRWRPCSARACSGPIPRGARSDRGCCGANAVRR